MVESKSGRRRTETAKLDIDRRKTESLRDESRRRFIDDAYETIYIPSYINLIYPKFPTTVHAFTNFLEQISPAAWAVNELGIEHAKAQKPLLPLRDFARLLIEKGLVTNAKGEIVTEKAFDQNKNEDYFLKTGT